MSKNKNSKVPQKKQTSDIVAPGKAVSDSQEYKDTVEIREKRIGIVFKVIYVIAIFFVNNYSYCNGYYQDTHYVHCKT